jgi:hypothetical protein
MARLDPKPFRGYPAMPKNAHSDRAVFDQWKVDEKAFWAKLDAAEAALATDDVVGVVCRFQIADGYAEYVVTKAKPLTLALIEGSGDGYQINAAHMRGLRAEDVLSQKKHNAFLRGLPRRQPLIALPPVPR